jgi:hypothetical protein
MLRGILLPLFLLTPLAARAEWTGLGFTAGPLIGVRSHSPQGTEYGIEGGVWAASRATAPVSLGVDVGYSNHAVYTEAQLAAPVLPRLAVGLSPGVAWIEPDRALQPQATAWFVVLVGGPAAHAQLALPLIPYLRLTGLTQADRVWQAGLMLKLPVGAVCLVDCAKK